MRVAAERDLLVDSFKYDSQNTSSPKSLSPCEDGPLGQHNRFFATILADTPELLEAAHALRYQVYCLERGFEKAAEHPDHLEKDVYDAQSIHGVLFDRPTRQPIGTVRTIMPKLGGDLPIVKLLQANSLQLSDYVDLSQTIELSRFAISKEFRRGKSDGREALLLAYEKHSEENINFPFLSLLQFVLRESLKHNVRFWAGVLEPRLLRMLARIGLCYTPIGPLVQHHGIRQPCYCYLPGLLENARRAQPRCWEVLTDGGLLHEQLLINLRNVAVA